MEKGESIGNYPGEKIKKKFRKRTTTEKTITGPGNSTTSAKAATTKGTTITKRSKRVTTWTARHRP